MLLDGPRRRKSAHVRAMPSLSAIRGRLWGDSPGRTASLKDQGGRCWPFLPRGALAGPRERQTRLRKKHRSQGTGQDFQGRRPEKNRTSH
eukprot:6517849-Pyramimonas_sp.AAC.1